MLVASMTTTLRSYTTRLNLTKNGASRPVNVVSSVLVEMFVR
jgi:hypothetical protein